MDLIEQLQEDYRTHGYQNCQRAASTLKQFKLAAERVAALNTESATIGQGMLVTIVQEAKEALKRIT